MIRYFSPLLFVLLFIQALVSTADTGMIDVKSDYTVKRTADRLEAVLLKKGLTVFKRVNHTAGANKVGLSLRPTELVIFGNPKIGTPLMQCAQRVAIDLPQKALIWEDAKGRVWLSYNQPNYLANRHSITGCDDVLKKISGALKGLAKAATEG